MNRTSVHCRVKMFLCNRDDPVKYIVSKPSYRNNYHIILSYYYCHGLTTLFEFFFLFLLIGIRSSPCIPAQWSRYVNELFLDGGGSNEPMCRVHTYVFVCVCEWRQSGGRAPAYSSLCHLVECVPTTIRYTGHIH